jgi:sulfur-carrier protein adenylyltransferase/sulfurtransferase
MKLVTSQELRHWQTEGKKFQLIDIREIYEVENENLGGKHIPMDEVLARTGELMRDIPVVLHCNSGKRSNAVVYALEQKFGFNNLYSLEGGIAGWNH